MKRQYLGDSYDAVKRLWQEIFGEWAPLHAEARFIPDDIRTSFTLFTRIPILGTQRPSFYAILNDPDTGVRLPGRPNQREGCTHVSLATIHEQLQGVGVRCVITFDQSSHREPGLTPKDQRAEKVRWLQHRGVAAFYYVSHAPFLFAFSGPKHKREARDLLRRAGMPDIRIEG